MPAIRLTTHRVEKPWGRRELWPGFENPPEDGEPIGEIWFQAEGEADPALLVKYLFTSEKLSIQVHPDDAAARAAGHKRGKDEAWVILGALPESTIALGPKVETTREHLRAAALDGSIETLVDWKPVAAGDTLYSGAGTVHAIGAGLTLVEVQQNLDLTYRLYDYGRPRALHLDEGIAVADTTPYHPAPPPREAGDGRTILIEGPKFVLERWSWGGRREVALPPGVSGWFVPLAGSGIVDREHWKPGGCWMLDGTTAVAANEGCDILFAYPGTSAIAL